MRLNFLKANLKTAVLVASVLLSGVGSAVAQSVNLTAAPSSLTLPGGAVPMWGYTCGSAVAGSTATCAKSNPTATGWSPVVITVPPGPLTINLTNSLTFGTNSVPTSLVIMGQLGGGLGTTATSTPSPDHTNAQTVTWPIADPTPANTPPAQQNRVQSFSTEVLAGATTALNWASLRSGTYLIESGTHPSIQGPMGLYGILVVTTAPAGVTPGTAYPAVGTAPAVTYSAEVPLLLSEIDPVQNNSVSAAVNTAGFSETKVWSGQPGGCGNPASGAAYHTCYPPAVNYTPLYYLINGVGFNKANASGSLFAASPGSVSTPVAGNVLVRFVNAGLRMHVPSIVGAATRTPAVGGFSLIAEDGNPLPGIPRVQSEVFMPAGKTYDVMINVPAAGGTGLPVYDRELSLSANSVGRDGGMLAYIGVNGAGVPVAPALSAAVANPDTYNSVVAGQTFTVSDPGKGVIANDVNVYGVQLIGTVAGLTLNADGTFTYTGAPTTFTYCANGSVTGATCSSGVTATVTLGGATVEAGSGITGGSASYTATTSAGLKIAAPGPLMYAIDMAGYPLQVAGATATTPVTKALTATIGSGTGSVTLAANGGFNATVSAAGTYTFTYNPQNSQGTASATAATVTLTFPTASGLAVKVIDGGDKTTVISDYRWIIEEDRTFYVNPNCTTNPPPAGCPTLSTGLNSSGGVVPTFGTNFHTSYMPVVATGCTGPLSCESGQSVQGVPAVCDLGNGICSTTASQETAVLPSQVHLDPTKRYYITVLPGDGATPFEGGAIGHGMGGAPIACTPATGEVVCSATDSFPSLVTIYAQPTPFPPSKLSVFVYEDDFPLNGEQDGGGGVDVLSPNEPGLGHFNITLFDDAGGTGDATGQMTYDMFNQPLSNSLAGTIDPATGKDACPVSKESRIGVGDPTQTGITGTIITCPKLESDGTTLSPLAGQAVIANMMPGRYGVVATPGADRIAAGEEWLQTNTLDGQKAHDSFLRVGEPSFFQEFGPAGFHVSIGFANPKIINGRLAGVCAGTDPTITAAPCTNTVVGRISTERMSRTPDERLYGSGSNDSFGFTQCYVSLGDPDGEDFAFAKCAGDGTFSIPGIPNGDWRVTVFDQWNDMLVDGLSTPVRLTGSGTDLGEIAINQWQANIYTKTFFDSNGNGIQDANEPGLNLVVTNNRFRDGSYSNFNNTDFTGNAGFNEVFPLFNWYVIETDSTRYKNTGIHVVYDAGGPADGTPGGGSSNIAGNMANTIETVPVPTNLRVPGARYCASADCPAGDTAGGSTGRIDPAWVTSEGWQGFSGQNSFIEFGKKPFAPTETGGIHGEVIYASTRPFDDPALLIHTSWTPDVPGVTINLYKEGFAADNITPTLTKIDTTTTSSWDNWAQGFRTDGVPNMNCPGQGRDTGTNADIFFFTLYNQPEYLDLYNSQHGGPTPKTLPVNSQFKCFDGMHNWNQVQPAPYDGMYSFPSVTGIDPTTGAPTGTNCTACVPNPDTTDAYRVGKPMLPAGKYVVEMVVPPGYELVKEEDKNILIGDNYIAPVTVQFPNLASAVYILPDQAEISSVYNANNPQNPTVDLGRPTGTLPQSEGDTGSVEQFWPCAGQARIVPDFISLFPGTLEVAPFAGATRNLCDRKEVTLTEQTAALAKFWVFTSTHVAAHFTGVITDDFTSEFDPFSPQFGEKFAPPYLPVAIKDWSGTEISRVYADQWGAYDGLTYSTWEVNPPNPTGYAPQMMVTCMNDPGTGPTPDPLFNPQYSQFCYELPFMPGQTAYLDTPVTPVSAFAGAGYNNPDCAYPTLTPAIKEVDGDQIGPWVSAAGKTLTITALGDQMVPNNAYSGPAATTAPYNQKTVPRHYGFGAAQGTVTIGGAAATVTGWSDTQITVTVPATATATVTAGRVPQCTLQQQAQYGGSTAYCGQLVITSALGQQSIDTVTVTIGGKAPTHVAASASIQDAIDAAKPGDLIIVDPTCTTPTATVACTTAGAVHTASTHEELLLMWKPVRLQGVGAVSSVINANTHPAGKLIAWRLRINCLFGLTPDGADNKGDKTCGSGWTNFSPSAFNPQIDRIPTEATIGWDATQNGNLAELLQEPSLMGALEGAGITVLSKGVKFVSSPYDAVGAVGGTFPAGTTLLTGSPTSGSCVTSRTNATNPFPSDFQCNPSSIDGLGITNSSQGGGGVFVHGWGHNIQIANNRINSNSGTLSGGINVGQGEFPPAYLGGAANTALNAPPGSCQSSSTANLQLPYCFDTNVNVHNNSVTSNSSLGDELFSATPAGAGGVSFCTGTDFYKFNFNWVCGNLSTGDGGGVGQLGFVYNGNISNNTIIFNQSTNPTIAANGGGLLVMGAPDVDPPCSTVDQDCVGATNLVGPSDGTGPGLVINANLLMGNSAESGSGGGIRLQNVNGSDVVAFPTTPARWYGITITNNIITNNVAGWDGAGISMVDALNVNFINNTVMSNDTTASSGVLFNTLGAPLASSEGPCAIDPSTGVPFTQPCVSASSPQPAGLVSIQNSAILTANLPATITCPAGHYVGTTAAAAVNGTCKTTSYPLLANNVFYQNRTFTIKVGGLGGGTLNQQNVVTLDPVLNQTSTGACMPFPATAYWDIGVRGDTGPTNHSSTVTLNPTYSFLTNAAGYASSNTSSNPAVTSQYCNGSRVPPEFGGTGYQVPPGISDATVPNPLFNLTPAATVDEGNNWINLSWGPLAETNPVTNATLGNYTPTAGAPTINYIASTGASAANYTEAPGTDFFGKSRKTDGAVDAGAVEFVASGPTAVASVTGGPLAFGSVATGQTSAAQTLTLHNTGTATLTGITVTVTAPFSRSGGTCLGTLAGAGATCTITVVYSPTVVGASTGTVTIAASVAVTGSPVALTGTGVAPVISATFLPTTWAITQTRNCPGTGILGILACTLDPSQVFTLTNTGNVPLTGITQGTLAGTGAAAAANLANFTRVNLLSTCGPATGGQLVANTTLAPGASCIIRVQFKPLTGQAAGLKTATISAVDSAGTQTSTLNGTAN